MIKIGQNRGYTLTLRLYCVKTLFYLISGAKRFILSLAS